MYRRTRIVATLGPATDRPGVLEAMLQVGVDVVRVNFSHGAAEEHIRRVAALRGTAATLGKSVAVLGDLPGPKLRVRLDQVLTLSVGQELAFSRSPSVPGDVSLTEPELLADVRPGQRILLDDGRLQLRAVRMEGHQVIARVEAGGLLLPNKGANLPDTQLCVPALTERDHEALAVAARAGVDWLALSFVRDAAAAAALREAARTHGLNVPILAKIERPEAVQLSSRIIREFDGLMVARGDLGVEIPLERVPHVQKKLIAQARAAGKPVITATDMLDSMRHNPRPTRAEASDVANAIYDGTDAVMLSGETAVGDYPVEAVACMDRIAREAERHLEHTSYAPVRISLPQIDDHVTQAACVLAAELGVNAILVPSISGRTARLVARHRPRAQVVALSENAEVRRQWSLIWGLCAAPLLESPDCAEDRLQAAARSAFAAGVVQPHDLAIVLADHPFEETARFPTVRVIRIGEGGFARAP
ncbi:MAG: pyruvate kinase [Gemmataceae bacterium]